MARKCENIPPKLTDPELDLLAHMEHGYQLETDSAETRVLRRLKVWRLTKKGEVNFPKPLPARYPFRHEADPSYS